MSTNDDNSSTTKANDDDILKSLRQLNSCITLTSVKNSNQDSPPPSSHSDSSSSDDEGDPGLPSALRGISIKGSDTLLSNLLGKKGSDEKKEEEKKKEDSSQSSWINEWSKRCLSISFSSKPSGGDKEEEGDEEEEEDEEEDGEEEGEEEEGREEGVSEDIKRRRLENGSPSSSSNSASNSRDSLPGNKNSSSKGTHIGNSSISIRPLPGAAGKSISLSVVKSKTPQPKEPLSIFKERDSLDRENERSTSTESRQSFEGFEEKQAEKVKKSPDHQPQPSRDEKTSQQPSREEKTSQQLSREEKTSQQPPREEKTSQQPLREEKTSQVPPREEKISQQPSSEEKTSHQPLREEKTLQQPPLQHIKPPQIFNNKDLPAPKETKFICSFCSQTFLSQTDLSCHIPKCNQLGVSVSFAPARASTSTCVDPVARKKTIKKPLHTSPRERLCCIRCKLNFHTWGSFENHHIKHVNRSEISVPVQRCAVRTFPNFIVEGSEDSDSRGSNSGESGTGLPRSSEDKCLKLKFKISSVRKRGRGQKTKTKVQIVSAQEMSEDFDDRLEGGGHPGEGSHLMEEEEDSEMQGRNRTSGMNEDIGEQRSTGENQGNGHGSAVPNPNQNLEGGGSSSTFGAFNNGQMNFGSTAPNERPPSTYVPQFESFTGDWFNEYESGSRIAAAMTGTPSDEAGHNESTTFNASSNGNGSGYNAEDSRNKRTSPFASSSDANKDLPVSSSNEGDGLFSQVVLGGDSVPGPEENRQGSFEQLCLNDSYGQNQQDSGLPQSGMDQTYQHSQPYNQAQGSGDILSELDYLDNNSQQQMDPTRVSPLDGERPFSSHSSNSGTPGSSGHPTPPPTDTSFRALATSPTSPMNSGGPTPPMQSDATPPMPNSSSSPLQQMQQQIGAQNQDAMSAPRLTIANNLMATTTNSGMGPIPSAFGQQWGPGANSQSNFNSTYLQPPSMAGTMGGALGGSIRPQVHANLPMGYRPSPPPRIRGRPPLMGHVGRPPMMRGPGRPPGSAALPPLMAAPGGTRGGMMPSLQRLPQYGAAQRQGMMGGQKRGASSVQSPSKSLRREDINVPSRQKDNECQIIAVANRTGDGMPVIANVQGGSRDDRSRVSPATTSESTIHLSDSITLSVRSNASGREPARAEKGGDAGVVANLLASRGITVAPAAGEKEGGGNGGREERRLPTASDLNLSSAISVHPPTSRDRDGFAVPHPPSAKSGGSSSSGSSSSSSSSGGGGGSNSNNSGTVNSQVDRPPRPPTVDLTQEIPSGGAQATRLACHQCDRTFPTQALLSDHAKVHQQQNQSRMPYKCHLCTAGFSTQKGQQHHYQQFHQLHLSPGDLAIPVVDFRNPANVQRMARLGIRSFLPLSNLQNRGASGVVGIPILTLENLHNGQMNLQQWGITDVLTLGPPRTMNVPR